MSVDPRKIARLITEDPNQPIDQEKDGVSAVATMYFDEGTGWTNLGGQSIDSALNDLRDDGHIVIASDTTVPVNPAQLSPTRAQGIRIVTGRVANDYFVLVGAG